PGCRREKGEGSKPPPPAGEPDRLRKRRSDADPDKCEKPRAPGSERAVFRIRTRSRDRTGTAIAGHRILSPACLPIPPFERPSPAGRRGKSTNLFTKRQIYAAYHLLRPVGCEPANLPVAPEPRELPLGVTARIALDERHGLLAGARA